MFPGNVVECFRTVVLRMATADIIWEQAKSKGKGISQRELDYYHQNENLRYLRKLRNFKEIPEMLGTDGKYPARNSEDKFWQLCYKIAKN